MILQKGFVVHEFAWQKQLYGTHLDLQGLLYPYLRAMYVLQWYVEA